jgi:hypothetical protein
MISEARLQNNQQIPKWKLKDTIEEITHKENEVYGDKDLAELGEDITVTSEEIKEAAAKINERLAEINNLDEEETKEVKKN